MSWSGSSLSVLLEADTRLEVTASMVESTLHLLTKRVL